MPTSSTSGAGAIAIHPARTAGLTATLARHRDQLATSLGVFAGTASRLLPPDGDDAHLPGAMIIIQGSLERIDFAQGTDPGRLADQTSELEILNRAARYLIERTVTCLRRRYGDQVDPLTAALQSADCRMAPGAEAPKPIDPQPS